jgi:predicted nucleic acid-binding protein
LKVLVDTSIWSLALRRGKSPDISVLTELESLISDFRLQLVGPIRQELLSGIKSDTQFNKLKQYLSSFPDYQIQTEDFVLAAHFFNQCRKKGIQGSNTDFLICAIAVNKNWQIYTSDQDFSHFKKVIPIKLHKSNK